YQYRRQPRYVYTGSLVACSLLAFGLVLVLLSFFPQSTVNGKFVGFQVSGAIAAFLVLAGFLVVQVRKILDKDKQTEAYEEQIKDLTRRLSHAARAQPNAETSLSGGRKFRYRVPGRRRRYIGLIAGNLHEVRDVDVWVNSENTNMLMA